MQWPDCLGRDWWEQVEVRGQDRELGERCPLGAGDGPP